MAEFLLGRLKFVWKGNWAAGTTYIKDDIVRYGGKTYVCLTGHVADLDPTGGFETDLTASRWELTADGQSYESVWTTNSFYKVNDIVRYGGRTYIATVAHTSAATAALGLESDFSNWDLYTDGFDWKGSWAPLTRYKANDVVQYGGVAYICETYHTSTSDFDEAKFGQFASGLQFEGLYNNSTAYQVGDVVTYGAYSYVCTVDTVGNVPTNGAYWTQLTAGVEWQADYNGSTTYYKGDIVKWGGYVYLAKSTTQGNQPDNATYWDVLTRGYLFIGEYNSGTTYKPGEQVTYGGDTYAAKISTSGNLPSNGTYWERISKGFDFKGEFDIGTTYGTGSIVRYGARLYTVIAETVGNAPPNLTYFSLFSDGFRWRNTWADTTSYIVGDVVSFGGLSYVCILNHTSNGGTDIAPPNPTYWNLMASGMKWMSTYSAATTYQINDVVEYNGSSYISIAEDNINNVPNASPLYWEMLAQGSSDTVTTTRGDLIYRSASGNSRLPVGTEGSVLMSNGVDPVWSYISGNAQFYVDADKGADDVNHGSINAPWASIAYACSQVTGPATIFVKSGTYTEVLPITVPANVSIVGDAQRTTIVQPQVGDEQETMWLLSNGSMLIKMTFIGLTGFTPGVDPEDPTTATKGGIFTALNPASPVTTKSPYILECTAISDGAIGAYVDGSVHASGNKSMLFHGYTNINDNGVSFWVDNGARAEIVSCFSYYGYYGYTATRGGVIRSLNGNCSYGTYGAISNGFDPNESTLTASLYGEQIEYVLTSGEFHKGETVFVSNRGGTPYTVGTSPATATIINVQSSVDKIYVKVLSGTFQAGDEISETATTSPGTAVIGAGDYSGQKGFVLTLSDLTSAETTATGTSGETSITVTSAAGISIDDYVIGANIASGARVTDIVGTAIHISIALTGNVSGTVTFRRQPKTGSSIEIPGDALTYVIQSVSEFLPEGNNSLVSTGGSGTIYSLPAGYAVVVLAGEKPNASAEGTALEIREKFSQIRLTGHDFLNIGTGGIETTNYPGTPRQSPSQANEVIEGFPGRVYYVSTDQDGNFRVGDYFRVDQATGRATLNASAFDLSGLTSLRLGSIGAQLGETINEFSSDVTMSGNSNTAVPTEAAVRGYFGTIDRDVLPRTTLTHDLGSSSKRWRSIYVGPGTISLGSLELKDVGGTLSVSLSGTGAPAGVAAPAISNGTSNIAISTEDGDITVTRGGTLNTTFDATGVVIEGNLTVKGNTTTINSTTVSVDDINIVLGDTASPTDTSANGGGITLKGTTDKTITYNNSTGRWTTNIGLTVGGALSVTPVDANVTLSPTGSGSVTINPATTGSINNVNIGTSTRGSGNFTSLDANGNVTLGSDTADTITVNGVLVNGTQIKTTTTTANTFSLAAYDVDGTAYTNLVTLTSGNTPTLDITSTGVGSINNMNIGASTRGTGAFTTLAANGAVTVQTTTNNQSYTTTGAGTITISSGTTGSIDNMAIGGSNRAAGNFTTLDANGNVTLGSDSSDTVTINGIISVANPFATGTVLKSNINSGNTLLFAAYDIDDGVYRNLITLTSGNTPTLAITSNGVGSIDNIDIGTTTRGSGKFTTLDANSSVTLSPANANVTISPTGSGTVTINPASTISITGSAGLSLGTAGQTTTMSGNISATTSGQTITLSPTGAGTVAIQPASTLTLGTSGQTTTMSGNISATGTNQTVTFSPTGTGTVTMQPAGGLTINPTTTGSVNNVNIGASTRGTGAFTTLGANNTVTFTGAINADTGTNNQSHTTTGAGTITISSGTTGSIDNMTIGGTTRAAGNFTNLNANGNVTLGDAVADSITVNGSFVTGTQLKTATTATNTFSLAAYDNDGAAYTNLVTLTAGNTPTIAITSTGVGTLDNITIGGTTRAAGNFTNLDANGNVTLGDSTADTITVNGVFVTGTQLKTNTTAANTYSLAAYDTDNSVYRNLVTLTAGATPTIAITSDGVGSIDNVNIGATTAGTGRFSSITTTGNVTIAGDLTVNGLTTTVNSNVVQVDDKNLELGAVAAVTGLSGTITTAALTSTVTGLASTAGLIPGMALTKTSGTGAFGTSTVIASVDSTTQITVTGSTAHTAGAINFDAGGATDVTADGGGITIRGTTNKTFTYDNANTRFTTNIGLNVGGALTASSGAVTMSPASANVAISPTGTGTVTIRPASTLTLGTSGVSTSVLGNISATTSNQTVTLSPTGTGTVTISPASTLTMNPSGAISITGASTLTLGTAGQTTTMNGNISATASNQTVTLSPTGTGTVSIQPASTLTLGTSGQTTTMAGTTITMSNATALNINGASPTIASTSTGTLTLFNTAITAVNAFGAATGTVSIGNAAGTVALNGAATVAVQGTGASAVTRKDYVDTTNIAFSVAFGW